MNLTKLGFAAQKTNEFCQTCSAEVLDANAFSDAFNKVANAQDLSHLKSPWISQVK